MQVVLEHIKDKDIKNGVLVVPEGVTAIGWGACMCRADLETVILSETVKTIDIGAFAACFNLKSVNIPNNIESIEKYAFRNCTSLQEVSIPFNTKVANDAFETCPARITYKLKNK